MKMRTLYACEHCGAESTDRDEIELCEARHLGLNTLEEKHTYDALKAAAQYAGSVVANTNNDQTREYFDKAVEALIAFEQEHHMK